jgi:CBS domain-containing protein
MSVDPSRGSYMSPSLENATVGDAMHPGILSCGPDASLTDVARMMATHHVHCIAVMGVAGEQGESLVWGIISDLDLLKASVEGDRGRTAASLALRPVVTVDSTLALRDAARLMLAHGSSHFVVTDPDTQLPIGMLSTLDVAGVVAWGEA